MRDLCEKRQNRYLYINQSLWPVSRQIPGHFSSLPATYGYFPAELTYLILTTPAPNKNLSLYLISCSAEGSALRKSPLLRYELSLPLKPPYQAGNQSLASAYQS